MNKLKQRIINLVHQMGFTIFKNTDPRLQALTLDYQESVVLEKIYEKFKNYTMIPKDTYLDNLRLCQQFSNQNGIVVECGVWRGGMSAGIAEILGNKFKCYLFDSFEGLPEVQEIDGEGAKKWQQDTTSEWYYDNCKAEIGFASEAMGLANNSNYEIVKGWFSDTLPKASFPKPISILRLDGDWYESTIQCLENLYPKLAYQGLIIIDDYYSWEGCTRAVHDYLSTHKLTDRISQTKNGVCYIIKNGNN